jgi:hypothetical protein
MSIISAETLQAIASRALRFDNDYEELLDMCADACGNYDVADVMNLIRLAVMQLKTTDPVSVQHSRTFNEMALKEARLQELSDLLLKHPAAGVLLQCQLCLITEPLDAETVSRKEQYENIKEWIAKQKKSKEWENAKTYRRRQLHAITNIDVIKRIEKREKARQEEATVQAMESVREEFIRESALADRSGNDAATTSRAELPTLSDDEHLSCEDVASAGHNNLQPVQRNHLADLGKTRKHPFSRKPLNRVGKAFKLKHMVKRVNEIVKSFKKEQNTPKKKKKGVSIPRSKISNGVNRRRTKNEADAYLYFAVFGPFFNFFKLGMSKNKPSELIRPYTRVNGPCVLLWRVKVLGDDSIRQARGKY